MEAPSAGGGHSQRSIDCNFKERKVLSIGSSFCAMNTASNSFLSPVGVASVGLLVLCASHVASTPEEVWSSALYEKSFVAGVIPSKPKLYRLFALTCSLVYDDFVPISEVAFLEWRTPSKRQVFLATPDNVVLREPHTFVDLRNRFPKLDVVATLRMAQPDHTGTHSCNLIGRNGTTILRRQVTIFVEPDDEFDVEFNDELAMTVSPPQPKVHTWMTMYCTFSYNDQTMSNVSYVEWLDSRQTLLFRIEFTDGQASREVYSRTGGVEERFLLSDDHATISVRKTTTPYDDGLHYCRVSVSDPTGGADFDQKLKVRLS